MNILLVAATQAEINPFLLHHGFQEFPVREKTIGEYQVSILISGIGMVATAFAMGKHCAEKTYDLAINAGIAGSFDPTILPGDLCRVSGDILAEFGAEDGTDFLNAEAIGLGKSLFYAASLDGFPKYNQLKKVRAVTVNKVHGNEKSIAEFVERFHPQIETMEGAAFFYSCEQAGIPGIQIRAISNIVERRNRENWQIEHAIKNLNDTLIQLFNA
ncbi:MAG: futalosine hydrolase [Daejeonella sp.]|uniref:futalosine hydrolase n=1 Tax=Daejeonella sp. TaxID=2805397 RepID=UPI0027361D86|nr:futalosine hydrolase [Daejeonella sp.]MDP3468326.1 futalosine hydrolase [Daejeonella sp.]